MFALGLPATFSLGPRAGVKGPQPGLPRPVRRGQQNFILPLGGLAIALLAGWLIFKGKLLAEPGKGGGGIAANRLVYTFIRFFS